jgi:hypothetical protein
MRAGELCVLVAGVLIILAVLGLTGFLVVHLSGGSPLVIAGVLTAFAAILAALPPIIKALRGR